MTLGEIRNYIEQMIIATIGDCAKIADRYKDEEAEEARRFERNNQPIPQATHAILSIVCSKIGNEIRALAAPLDDPVESGSAS